MSPQPNSAALFAAHTAGADIADMPMIGPSARGKVPPFLIMEMYAEAAELARQGRDIIHLSLGQPGSEVPPAMRAKLAELVQTQPLGYTEAAGIPALRARIAQHYLDSYGVTIAPERIFITIGSSSAFILSLIAAFDAGDEIALTRPCYPAYPSMVQGLNLQPVFLRGTPETRFQPTPAMLDALPRRPKGMVVASPSNPSGTVLSDAELKTLAEYADARGIRLIADEIYHGITYGTPTRSITAYSQSAIVVNSFSKYFLMPGWRLGWAVMPEDLVQAFEYLLQHFFISPSAMAQYAALEVFNHKPALDAEVAMYARNRAFLLEALPKMGLNKLAQAEGGFFIYADVSHLTNDSVAWCKRMMQEIGVITIPGVDFDAEEGHRYVRFSFSNGEAKVREAMARLQAWLG